jgi:hypothetical protein
VRLFENVEIRSNVLKDFDVLAHTTHLFEPIDGAKITVSNETLCGT